LLLVKIAPLFYEMYAADPSTSFITPLFIPFNSCSHPAVSFAWTYFSFTFLTNFNHAKHIPASVLYISGRLDSNVALFYKPHGEYYREYPHKLNFAQ